MARLAEGVNRRGARRVSAAYTAQLQPIQENTSSQDAMILNCLTRDISETGVALWVKYPCRLQSTHVVTFEHEQGLVPQVVSRLGAVVWRSTSPADGHYAVGIKFEDVGAG